MSFGAASGFLGYAADWAANGADPSKWSWRDAGVATAIGAGTAGLGRYFAPELAAGASKVREFFGGGAAAEPAAASAGEAAATGAPAPKSTTASAEAAPAPKATTVSSEAAASGAPAPKTTAASAEAAGAGVPAPRELVGVGGGGDEGGIGVGGGGNGGGRSGGGGGGPVEGSGGAPPGSVAEPPPPRPFEPEPLAPGETVDSEGLTPAQQARFRQEIDKPPPGKTADDVRYERHLQKRANLGDEPLTRDEWQASNDQLRTNSGRGTARQDAAREGLGEHLGRDLADNNQGQVVQRTVTDPRTGEPVTTRPDSIGRNENGEIDLVHDHKDLSGSKQVVYDDAQIRAERQIIETPDGQHVVTVSSDRPNLTASPPEPRPSGPLATDSDVYFTDGNGRVTHQW